VVNNITDLPVTARLVDSARVVALEVDASLVGWAFLVRPAFDSTGRADKLANLVDQEPVTTDTNWLVIPNLTDLVLVA
jgi:hypothetical protein